MVGGRQSNIYSIGAKPSFKYLPCTIHQDVVDPARGTRIEHLDMLRDACKTSFVLMRREAPQAGVFLDVPGMHVFVRNRIPKPLPKQITHLGQSGVAFRSPMTISGAPGGWGS